MIQYDSESKEEFSKQTDACSWLVALLHLDWLLRIPALLSCLIGYWLHSPLEEAVKMIDKMQLAKKLSDWQVHSVIFNAIENDDIARYETTITGFHAVAAKRCVSGLLLNCTFTRRILETAHFHTGDLKWKHSHMHTVDGNSFSFKN